MGKNSRATWMPVLLLALTLLVVGRVEGGAEERAFAKFKAVATRLMHLSGKEDAKAKTIAALRDDNARRSAEILVKWRLASEKLRRDRLEPEVETVKAKLNGYRAKMVKKHGPLEPRWTKVVKRRVAKRKADYEEALRLVHVEIEVDVQLAKAVDALSDQEATRWMAELGLTEVLDVPAPSHLVASCIKLVMARAPEVGGAAIVAAVQRHNRSPWLRIRMLEWIGAERVPRAAPLLGQCLQAPSIPVRRAAVRAMKTLDDPACVPLLIKGLSAATGLHAAEITDVLHQFTGKTLGSDARPWSAWWKAEGQSWLASVGDARHGVRDSKGGVGFYGISSPSNRIVFVLDRSGSMKRLAATAPKGPVTGKNKVEEATAMSLLALAKRELRRTISRLDPSVKFNIVFYSRSVSAWKDPPELVGASPKNKVSARAWFRDLNPSGSTELFKALHKALDYADKLDEPGGSADSGVDTIFLLSDGSPTFRTSGKSRNMSAVAINEAVDRFLTANAMPRCVVHTIGVGPHHNVALMERLASATGGHYVAVGSE